VPSSRVVESRLRTLLPSCEMYLSSTGTANRDAAFAVGQPKRFPPKKMGVDSMKLLPLFVALTSLLCTGCGPSEAERTRAAVLRVLQAEKVAHDEHLGPPPADADMAYMLRTLDAYCRKMNSLELEDCPADFRLAFRNHVDSWRAVGDDIRKLNGQNGDVLTEVLKGLSILLTGHQEPPPPHPLDVANKRTRETYAELEKVGARYGAVL
jgi:hypothetical protein